MQVPASLPDNQAPRCMPLSDLPLLPLSLPCLRPCPTACPALTPPSCSEVRKMLIGRLMCERYTTHLGLDKHLVMGKSIMGGWLKVGMCVVCAECGRGVCGVWVGEEGGPACLPACLPATRFHPSRRFRLDSLSSSCRRSRHPAPACPAPCPTSSPRCPPPVPHCPAVQSGGVASANMKAELFEAVMGAVYLDGDLDAVRRCYIGHFPLPADPLSLLRQGGAARD